MKKPTAFFVLLLAVIPAFAGDFGFRFGLKASPNISWFRTETRGYQNIGVGVGYTYGLIVDYEFAENYAIRSGLNFMQTGGKLKYNHIHDGIVTDKQRKHRLRYLEVPVALKLSTFEMGYTTYFGLFGVGLGFNSSAIGDDRITLPGGGYIIDDKKDIADEVRFLRAGLLIGAGAEYNFGGMTSLLIGLTFHNGFSNVLEKKNPAVSYTPSANSHYLELTIGILF